MFIGFPIFAFFSLIYGDHEKVFVDQKSWVFGTEVEFVPEYVKIRVSLNINI